MYYIIIKKELFIDNNIHIKYISFIFIEENKMYNYLLNVYPNYFATVIVVTLSAG